MTTQYKNDFGELITTKVINGQDYDYYLDQETKRIMILVDSRPLFKEPKTASETLKYFAKKLTELS